MAMSSLVAAAKQQGGAPNKFADFAVAFTTIFSIAYLFVLNYGWALGVYYPASGQWTWWRNLPLGTPGPAMKWYGYVLTSGIIAAVGATVVAFLPESLVKHIRWYGFAWLVPIFGMIAVIFLIFAVGD
jgi:hypothetical protein